MTFDKRLPIDISSYLRFLTFSEETHLMGNLLYRGEFVSDFEMTMTITAFSCCFSSVSLHKKL